jgi:GxxExxY protein
MRQRGYTSHFHQPLTSAEYRQAMDTTAPMRVPDDALTRRVIGCAIAVHRELGPGLLENVYETCLCDELEIAGLRYVRQRPLPLIYKGRDHNLHYTMDLVVDEVLVLEIKAVHQIHPTHEAQLLTYLRLSGLPLGLLLNFNAVQLKDGIRRKANTTRPRGITPPTTATPVRHIVATSTPRPL